MCLMCTHDVNTYIAAVRTRSWSSRPGLARVLVSHATAVVAWASVLVERFVRCGRPCRFGCLSGEDDRYGCLSGEVDMQQGNHDTRRTSTRRVSPHGLTCAGLAPVPINGNWTADLHTWSRYHFYAEKNHDLQERHSTAYVKVFLIESTNSTHNHSAESIINNFATRK